MKINDKLQFYCEKDGLLGRDDVEFWCNRCSRSEVTHKDGMYLCPTCLVSANGNFRCKICGGTSVKMVERNSNVNPQTIKPRRKHGFHWSKNA